MISGFLSSSMFLVMPCITSVKAYFSASVFFKHLTLSLSLILCCYLVAALKLYGLCSVEIGCAPRQELSILDQG